VLARARTSSIVTGICYANASLPAVRRFHPSWVMAEIRVIAEIGER
jgi:hypothetical protein